MAEIPKRKKTEAARVMRGNATPAERRLWQHLRGRKTEGFKFRRQVPLGDYVADFFCAEAKLVVEVDGSIHDLRAGQDAIRTQVLERGGPQVLRFPNEHVLEQTADVLTQIVATCKTRTQQ